MLITKHPMSILLSPFSVHGEVYSHKEEVCMISSRMMEISQDTDGEPKNLAESEAPIVARRICKKETTLQEIVSLDEPHPFQGLSQVSQRKRNEETGRVLHFGMDSKTTSSLAL